MSTSIKINEVALIPIKEAAKKVSYSRDYIARLAREKKITASQISRQWFVDMASLQNFIDSVEIEQKIRKQNLSDERKRDLQVKNKLDLLHKSIKQRRNNFHFQATFVTILVLCFGLLSGITLYNTEEFTKLSSSLFPVVAGIGANVSLPVTENNFKDTSVRETVSFSDSFSVQTVIADTKTPVFVDEIEVRSIKNSINGILLLADDGEVKTESQVEALFSDEVSVEFTDTNEGKVVVNFEDEDTKEFPFVTVPVSEEEVVVKSKEDSS